MSKLLKFALLLLASSIAGFAQGQQPIPTGLIPVNGHNIDMMSFVTTAVDNLANAYSGLFLSLAWTWLPTFLAIGVFLSGAVWIVLSAAEGKRMIVTLIVSYIAVVYMLRYYDNPLPGVGIPFGQIFRFEGRFLSAQIDIGLLNVFLQNVSDLFKNGDRPNPWNMYETIGYVIVLCMMAIPEIILFVENSTAILALGLGAVFGPISIVLYVLPFRWSKALFWAYVHYMLKYAMYRVFASAITFVGCTAQMLFLRMVFNNQYSLPVFMGALFGLIVFNISLALTCFRIGHLVADYFGGHANGGSGGAQSVINTAMMAARFL